MKKESIETLNIVGGALCLDFINTIDTYKVHGRWPMLDGRLTDHPREWLQQYSDLIAWSLRVKMLTRKSAEKLSKTTSGVQRRRVLKQALFLRELLYRLFSRCARSGTVASADLEAFNRIVRQGSQEREIIFRPGGKRFEWNWNSLQGTPNGLLWPIVQSAVELLTSSHLQAVRACDGSGCGWLFLDLSRNHSRRWCNMNSCGNRDKVLRHYYRKTRAKNTAPQDK